MIRAFIFFILLLFATETYAQNSESFPKSGVLSIVILSNSSALKVPLPWGAQDDLTSGKMPPIMGSLRQDSNDQWTIKITNTLGDKYMDAGFEFALFNGSNTKLKSYPFNYALKPKQSVEITTSGVAGASFAQLSLLSWKER